MRVRVEQLRGREGKGGQGKGGKQGERIQYVINTQWNLSIRTPLNNDTSTDRNSMLTHSVMITLQSCDIHTNSQEVSIARALIAGYEVIANSITK